MKNRFSLRFLLLLLVALSLPSFAKAQENEQEVEIKQVTLTPDTVKNFIGAFQDIKAWQKSLDTTSKTTESDEDLKDSEEHEEVISVPQDAASAAKMQDILKKHNFSTLESWEQTAQSVMLAYGYADPDNALSDPKKAIADSIEEIKKDTTLSEDEKKQAIKSLNEQVQVVDKMKPLPGNIETVKPYVPEIKKMVESE